MKNRHEFAPLRREQLITEVKAAVRREMANEMPATDAALEVRVKEIVDTYLSSNSNALKGEPGERGPIGITGVPGEDGKPGTDGSDGLDGKDATDTMVVHAVTEYINSHPDQFRGQQGPQGIQGERGVQGIQGAVGPRGEIGSTGKDGSNGAPGLPGERGPKGDTGATGANGAIGPQGIQGVPGIKGDTGLQGIQGVKGDTGSKGDKGDAGQNATFRYLNTTGSMKVYTASGVTDVNGAVSFTIPSGYFTNVYQPLATVVRDTNDPTAASFATVRSYSNTTVIIQVFESKTTPVLLGGVIEGIEASKTAGIPVLITVIGI